jgi:hypothetical protein
MEPSGLPVSVLPVPSRFMSGVSSIRPNQGVFFWFSAGLGFGRAGSCQTGGFDLAGICQDLAGCRLAGRNVEPGKRGP